MVLGNEEDFSAALGFELEGVDENLLHLELEAYARLLEQVLVGIPEARAGRDDPAGGQKRDGQRLVGRLPHAGGVPRRAEARRLEILDRVGGGDSFASGLVYGLLNGWAPEKALAYGVAHGALAMTTPGDTSMATLAEVERLVAGASARVQRAGAGLACRTCGGTIELAVSSACS